MDSSFIVNQGLAVYTKHLPIVEQLMKLGFPDAFPMTELTKYFDRIIVAFMALPWNSLIRDKVYNCRG